MNPTDTFLKELKQRLERATPGPWSLNQEEGWPVAFATGESAIDGKKYHVHTMPMSGSELTGDAKTDAELIAHAPTDLKRLISMVELLIEEIKLDKRNAPLILADLDAIAAGEGGV
jgi:hypothetical protein